MEINGIKVKEIKGNPACDDCVFFGGKGICYLPECVRCDVDSYFIEYK